MRLAISRPLFALLLSSVVASMVALLRPPLDAMLVNDLLPVPGNLSVGSEAGVGHDEAWHRRTVKPPTIDSSFSVAKKPDVVLPETAKLAVVEPVVPSHGFVYLGRMVRDDTVLAFIGKGEGVDVVAVGEVIGSEWRLDAIGPQGLQLRYLPLDAVRYLAMRPVP
jgi:hypothetical protein